MNKKIILSTLLCSCLAFGGDVFDLENAFFKKASFSTIVDFKVFAPQGEIPLKIDLTSKIAAIEHLKEGGYKTTTIIDALTKTPDGHLSKSQTTLILSSDKFFRTTELSENTVIDGQKKELTCKPDVLTKKEDNLQKEIGYEFEPETLICDDGTARVYSAKVVDGENNTANIVVSSSFQMKQGNVLIDLKDKSVSNIDKNGHINYIESNTLAFIKDKKIFSMSFKVDKIDQ